MKKSTNPYAKKTARKRRITRKQRTSILCGLLAAALLIGLVVVSRVAVTQTGGIDNHAGHDHAEGETNSTGHSANDGHNHGNSSTNSSDSKLRYQLYRSGDTFTYAIYNADNQLLLKKENLELEPIKMAADNGLTQVYFRSKATGFTVGETIYCDEKNGRISDAFHGEIGSDGVRVAYCSADDTTIIVQDLFDKNVYYKEYPLTNPYTGGKDIIKNGSYKTDTQIVAVSYLANDGTETRTMTVPMYE